jgi:hypothetical protein
VYSQENIRCVQVQLSPARAYVHKIILDIEEKISVKFKENYP